MLGAGVREDILDSRPGLWYNSPMTHKQTRQTRFQCKAHGGRATKCCGLAMLRSEMRPHKDAWGETTLCPHCEMPVVVGTLDAHIPACPLRRQS